MTQNISILRRHLSRAEIRSIDQIAIQRFGMTGLVLMENAGRNAAETIQQLAPDGDICVLCGKGNNGGDGYVIARHLELMNRVVRIVSCVDLSELSGDAASNQRIAALAQIPIAVATEPNGIASAIGHPHVIVDCLLGTGAYGNPREPIASAIRCSNQLAAIRIAIDIPSGLDCDTGVPADPTFLADHTLTFVAMKTGFTSNVAAPFLGAITVLSIGVPACLLREFC